MLLEAGEDAERLPIPLEAAIVAHLFVQRPLAAVPERRVPEIVGEASSLQQVSGREPVLDLRIYIAIQSSFANVFKEAVADLGAFDRVCQPCAVEVAFADSHNLCLALQTAKAGGVDDPRPISRERVALVPGKVFLMLLAFREDRLVAAGHVRLVSIAGRPTASASRATLSSPRPPSLQCPTPRGVYG